MIKLGVISDSHWERRGLAGFAKRAKEQGYDAVIHCGDGLADAQWLEDELKIPVHRVAGNCDLRMRTEKELRLTFERVRLMVVHGDRFGVKMGLSRLSYYAEEAGAHVVLFGHTHEPTACYAGKVMMVNPGSLAMGCYAELMIDGDKAAPYLKDL